LLRQLEEGEALVPHPRPGQCHWCPQERRAIPQETQVAYQEPLFLSRRTASTRLLLHRRLLQLGTHLSGFSTAGSKSMSVVRQPRMVSSGDDGVYTGSGLRGVIPYVQCVAVVLLTKCARSMLESAAESGPVIYTHVPTPRVAYCRWIRHDDGVALAAERPSNSIGRRRFSRRTPPR
jgi:hypothetical protein